MSGATLAAETNGRAAVAEIEGVVAYGRDKRAEATERLLAAIPEGQTEEHIEQEVRVVRLASPRRLEVHLTPNERRLLACLRQHAEAVVAYEVLSYALYGPIFDAARDISSIQVYITQLRSKLEPYPRSPRYIINYPGVGYALYPNGLEVPELSPGAAQELGTTRSLALPPEQAPGRSLLPGETP